MKRILRNLFMLLLIMGVSITGKNYANAAEVQYTDNVIPVMTSNTSPGGVASASSVWSDGNGSYPAWKAFNYAGFASYDGWVTSNGTTTGWLSYEFTSEKCITKYSIISRNVPNCANTLPKDWTFEAWNKQLNTWVVLDTRKSVTNWQVGVKKEFPFSNTNFYNKYRINITANCGFINYTAISELEMMETVSAPTNLVATSGDSNVKLTWNTVSGATNYIVKRSTSAGGPYTTQTTEKDSVNTFTDKDVKNGTKYYYVVRAVVEGKESTDSKEVSATPQVGIPSSPNKLSALSGDKQVTLSWTGVSGATGYNVKRFDKAGGPYTTVASGAAITSTTFNDLGVENGKTYYYVVTAVNAGGESGNSNEASATLPDVVSKKLKVVLEPKEVLQLSVDDDLTVNTELIWTSSDSDVATVNSNGEVTALKPGNTKIMVTSKDGTYTDVINVLVVDNADDYRLAVDLKVGKSCRLTIDDYTNTVPVTWTSMDPTVATISSKGKVTAVGKGLVLMTAKDNQGNDIGQVYVRVRE